MYPGLFELSKKDAALKRRKVCIFFCLRRPFPTLLPSPPPWQFIPNLLTKPHAIDVAVSQAHILY